MGCVGANRRVHGMPSCRPVMAQCPGEDLQRAAGSDSPGLPRMSLWTTAVYEDENGRSPFATWLSGLSEAKFAALDAAITQVLCQRGIDLAGTEWLKALGEGLWEFRVRHDAAEINHMFGNEVTAPLRREGTSFASSVTSTATRSSCCSAATTRAAIPPTSDRRRRSPGRVSASPPGRKRRSGKRLDAARPELHAYSGRPG
jgi:hypothetical protein